MSAIEKDTLSETAPHPQARLPRPRPTAMTWIRLRAMLGANSLLIGVVAMVVGFRLLNGAFLTIDNFTNIFVQSSYIAVVAVPMGLLLIAGRVDLSVGSVLALGGVTTGILLSSGVDTLVACLAGVSAGAAVGLANGVLTTVWPLSPIIVTLGSLTAVRGLVLWMAPGPLFNFGDDFINLGEGNVAGIPYLVVIAAVVLAAGAALLTQLPIGRHIFAIGVNEEAAYLSGVQVKRISLLLFTATGAAAGLAGVMLAARLGSAPSGALGVGFELDVLTAVLLGGVAFAGGRGSVQGVLLGVLFLAILKNGLTLENVPATIAAVIKGLVLIGAAALDLIAVRASSDASRLVGRDHSGDEGAAP